MRKNGTKKAAVLLLCAVLTVLTAAACAQSVRPGPSALVSQIVAGRTFHARLAGYTWSGDAADMSLTFTLCEQETFTKEEVEALQEGDEIIVGGYPYEVYTVSTEDGQITVNRELEFTDTLIFRPQDDGSYTVTMGADIPVWRGSVAVICPVSPDAIFLDWGDPEAELPTTCSMDELMDRLIDDAILLTPDNTEITFDEEGRLSVLLYQYTPMN